jgi:signal transduction histidine kinase
MPGMSGMEVISRVHELDPQIVVVVITGYATIDTAVEAMKCGAYDFLPKPFSADEFRLIVNRALERRRLVRETQRHEIERAMLTRRFVTFVAHQLRTPLAAVHQYLDVMQRVEQSPAKQREWLVRCLTRIEELQDLISDWLTLARVESGALHHERVQVSLTRVIGDLLAAYEQIAAVQHVTLENQLQNSALWVTGDRNCLVVLFDNLITNAIKYNKPEGRVIVRGQMCAGEAVIEVADEGIGIPDKYRPYLFDEFFRVPDQQARSASGVGLGLHICKKIVSEMGGSIGVESEPGMGSIFRVRLPAATKVEAEVHEETHSDSR